MSATEEEVRLLARCWELSAELRRADELIEHWQKKYLSVQDENHALRLALNAAIASIRATGAV